jgi:hypothetical protein
VGFGSLFDPELGLLPCPPLAPDPWVEDEDSMFLFEKKNHPSEKEN